MLYMKYLEAFRTHQNIEEMNASVRAHIATARLTGNVRKVLECLAKHSLKYVGACHIKAETIAAELGLSRSTVTRCIKKLKERHVIHVYNNRKMNGIKGANIYAIIFLTHSEPTTEPLKLSHRATPENIVIPRATHVKTTDESLSLNLLFNPFVHCVNNVTASATSGDLKETLKMIYQPNTEQEHEAFEELCKIAFGRLKQFIRSHQVPYLQLETIIVRCMKQLIAKQGVRNQFAMYSKMIERQVLQLFEQPIQPRAGRCEVVPEWFYARDAGGEDSLEGDVDFEVRRAEVLEKLGDIMKK